MTSGNGIEACIARLTDAIVARLVGGSMPQIDPSFVEEAIDDLKVHLPAGVAAQVFAAAGAHRATIEASIRDRAFQAAYRRKLMAACGVAGVRGPVRVFLSYRRAETEDLVRHIAANLRNAQGISVFHDVASLVEGPFPEQLGAHVRSCDVFVLVITSTTFERTHLAGDWVRREIETALEAGKRIIPLCIDNARVPDRSAIPGSLERLVAYNALDFYPAMFDASIQRLCSWLKQ